MPHSVSTWVCDNCPNTAEITYRGIQDGGVPYCPNCDCDMTLAMERWEENDG